MGSQQYIVAPASMLVPGVLNGSKGPLYYPKSEVIKNHIAWNGMPLTLGHPSDNEGRGTSARNPSIMAKYSLGFVYNTTVSRGKLDAEAWFDIDKTNAIAPEIITRLESGQPIELSTGLFTDNFPVKNKSDYNGRQYVAVAKNYKPDHLAVLLDTRGACSLSDGCGVLVNQASDTHDLVTNCGTCPKDGHGCGCTGCKDKAKKAKKKKLMSLNCSVSSIIKKY